MNTCPHDDRRRGKYVHDGEVYRLCEECHETWTPHSKVTLHERPAPPDDKRLAEDFHNLRLLRENVIWHEEQLRLARRALRDELNLVHKRWGARSGHKGGVTWTVIGQAMGISRQAVELYARYSDGTGTYLFGDRAAKADKERAKNRAEWRRWYYRDKARREGKHPDYYLLKMGIKSPHGEAVKLTKEDVS